MYKWFCWHAVDILFHTIFNQCCLLTFVKTVKENWVNLTRDPLMVSSSELMVSTCYVLFQNFFSWEDILLRLVGGADKVLKQMILGRYWLIVNISLGLREHYNISFFLVGSKCSLYADCQHFAAELGFIFTLFRKPDN